MIIYVCNSYKYEIKVFMFLQNNYFKEEENMMTVEPKLVREEKEPMQILREHCKNVVRQKVQREEEKRQEAQREKEKKKKEVQAILENWLNKKFGYGKKPWRAVEGMKKRVRPIPFYEWECSKKWTEISKESMIEIVKELGFKVYTSLNGDGINLSIPELKNGEKLTWAQEKIKRLNHDYSMYADDEKKLAQFIFKEILLELSNYDIDKTEVCDGYTLFRDYEFGETMGLKTKLHISRKCYKFIKRLYRENKMEEYYVDGNYLGVRVFKTE